MELKKKKRHAALVAEIKNIIKQKTTYSCFSPAEDSLTVLLRKTMKRNNLINPLTTYVRII